MVGVYPCLMRHHHVVLDVGSYNLQEEDVMNVRRLSTKRMMQEEEPLGKEVTIHNMIEKQEKLRL